MNVCFRKMVSRERKGTLEFLFEQSRVKESVAEAESMTLVSLDDLE